MKDFSLDLDPTTESYTDMSLDSILSQYKLESNRDDLSGSDDSGYSSLYDDEDDDVRVYTPGAASARRAAEPEDTDSSYDGYADDGYDAQDYGYDSAVSSRADDYGEEDNSKPFPTIPGIDHLKSFLKSKLKPKSEKHSSRGRSKPEPADDYDDPGYSDTADGQDYASEYTETYYTDEDYGYAPDGSGAYDSAPAQSTWQYDDGSYNEPQQVEELEHAPPATEHSGARGAMEQDARRYIAQMQAGYEQDYAEPKADKI